MVAVGRFAGLVLAFLLLGAVQPAAARDCEAWNGHSQIRCLTSGSGPQVAGETVTVRNGGAETVFFSMQKWFSACGTDSEHEPTLVKSYQVDAGNTAILTTAQSNGIQETCTELFIFDCRAGDQSVDCAQALKAEIAAQSPAPAPTAPLRRACEAWKGGTEFRCLSSFEDAYAAEPVHLQSIWGGEVSFAVQEWYSLCGYQAAVPPTAKETHSLPAGAMLRLAGRALPAEVETFNPAACREIFIFECRVGGTSVPCTSSLIATIGP